MEVIDYLFQSNNNGLVILIPKDINKITFAREIANSGLKSKVAPKMIIITNHPEKLEDILGENSPITFFNSNDFELKNVIDDNPDDYQTCLIFDDIKSANNFLSEKNNFDKKNIKVIVIYNRLDDYSDLVTMTNLLKNVDIGRLVSDRKCSKIMWYKQFNVLSPKHEINYHREISLDLDNNSTLHNHPEDEEWLADSALAIANSKNDKFGNLLNIVREYPKTKQIIYTGYTGKSGAGHMEIALKSLISPDDIFFLSDYGQEGIINEFKNSREGILITTLDLKNIMFDGISVLHLVDSYDVETIRNLYHSVDKSWLVKRGLGLRIYFYVATMKCGRKTDEQYEQNKLETQLKERNRDFSGILRLSKPIYINNDTMIIGDK